MNVYMPYSRAQTLIRVSAPNQAGEETDRTGGMKNLTEIIQMGRFRFLIAGFVLFSMGSLAAAYAGSVFDLNRFLLGYLAVGTGHLSIHYSNEYFDRDSDQFGRPSAFSGGSGVLIQHPELAETAYRVATLLIALSVGFGLVYAILYPNSLSVLALVLVGNLLGWYYSAPPIRMVARGWGEFATALGIGGVIPGVGYLVIAGTPDPFFFVFSIPLFCYGCYFIMNVEIPDEEADRRAGKWTIVAKRGQKFGLQVVLVSALGATLWYLVLSFVYEGLLVVALFSLIPLATAVRSYTKSGEVSPRFHHVQKNIVALIFFCVLVGGFLLIRVMS